MRAGRQGRDIAPASVGSRRPGHRDRRRDGGAGGGALSRSRRSAARISATLVQPFLSIQGRERGHLFGLWPQSGWRARQRSRGSFRCYNDEGKGKGTSCRIRLLWSGRPRATTLRPTIRASSSSIAGFRPSPICAAMPAGTCRASPLNTWTAVRAPTAVSPATGARSMRSSSCRATASLRPCRRSISNCSAGTTLRRSASPPWAAPRSCGPAPTNISPPRRSARVPYTLGLVGGMTVERAAEIAPDVLWFQLYRCFRNEHAIGFDLVRRAEAAGVHVLVLTADVPVRTTRPREVAAGITSPFRPDLRMLAGILASPGYLRSLWKHGQPRFGNLKPYTADTADVDEVAAFVRREMGGAFTWDEVARYRERWKRPLVVKGILHPADAERCVSLGVDGIVVSNHGGRQVEALPAAIDVLPAIV